MLTLPIKKKWFDMILSGEKTEEYREIKPYWTSRFKKIFDFSENGGWATNCDIHCLIFQNGYGKNAPRFEARCILEIGQGKEEWGAEPNKEYYVLKILEIKEVEE